MKWFFPSMLINRNCCLNNGSELWPIIRMFSFLSHPYSGPYTAKTIQVEILLHVCLKHCMLLALVLKKICFVSHLYFKNMLTLEHVQKHKVIM